MTPNGHRTAAPHGRTSPAALLFAGLVTFAATWLAVLAYTSLAAPVDNIEQLTWVRSLEWGYYKHPPLATWLFWAPVHLLGLHAWTTYLTGAAFTLGAILLQWRLLRELRGRRYATLALAAVLCITYYNDRLYYYNHNVVLMLFATAALCLCWKASSSGKLRWWAALGVALGLGGLAKYQMAVVFACVVVHWVHQRGWRDQVQRTGLLLATLIALVIFVPHVEWLRSHDFGPIQYAMESSLGAHVAKDARGMRAANWVADQLLNRALPAWLLLGVAVFAARRSATGSGHASPGAGEGGRPLPAGRALLVIWGVVPLVFMPVVGLVFGADLQLQWGTSFLLFAVPAVMELLGSPATWSRWRTTPPLAAFVTLQVLMLVVNFVTSPRGPAVTRDTHWRSFPIGDLAKVLGEPARHALAGRAICVVSGPASLAGALALELPERPLVLIDGRYDRSPWVNPRPNHPCGVLELSESSLAGWPVGRQFPGLRWRASDAMPADERAGRSPRRQDVPPG